MRAAARAAARTSSTSAWATPICRRRRTSSTSWSRSRRSPTRTAIRSRRASPGCAARRPTITAAASASRSIPRPRSSSPWVEGGARQPRHRDHRAGRRRARAQPELPDPHLRLHHRRRDDPRGADDARRGVFRSARARDRLHRAAPRRAGGQLSAEPDRRNGRSRFLRAAGRLGARGQVWIISDLAYSELYITTASRPSRSSGAGGAKDIAVEFTSLVEDLFDGRLADRLRGRQQPS